MLLDYGAQLNCSTGAYHEHDFLDIESRSETRMESCGATCMKLEAWGKRHFCARQGFASEVTVLTKTHAGIYSVRTVGPFGFNPQEARFGLEPCSMDESHS